MTAVDDQAQSWPSRLSGRGRRPAGPARRAVPVIAGAAAVLLLVSAVWAWLDGEQARGPVARVVSVSTGATSARVYFTVTKAPGERAFCVVYAHGQDGTEVGRDVVAVDPVGNDATDIATTATLPTNGEAVTAAVQPHCATRPPR